MRRSLAKSFFGSPRPAGPQPRDGLRLARFFFGSPRPAGPQPRDGLRLAKPFYGWIVVGGAFVTMGIGVNARPGFSLLFPPILHGFSWPPGLHPGAFSFRFPLAV